jgi:hypothetical protein
MIETKELAGNLLPGSGAANKGYRTGNVVVIHGVAVGPGTKE